VSELAVVPDEDLGHGIVAVDTGYFRPAFDASHLLVESGRAALVDVGTGFSAPALMAALGRAGLRPEAVDYVILTHVHLDHAGGAGEMMRRLPRAKLVVHPRGARHMIDPSALWAGALAVYGEEGMRRSYGELVPVPAERVIEAPDGFRLDLGGRSLLFLDTPGHARHHVCVWDEASRGIFTGDTLGLAYRELAGARGPLLLPTTTPVQFEPQALVGSIDRLLELDPQRLYLTHYSLVLEPSARAGELKSRVAALVALGRAADGRGDRAAHLRAAVADTMVGWALDHGCQLPPPAIRELLAVDVELNVQGLEVWLDRGGRG
jgi:glyoxylase-like metal-dependent hydrolase (beta-lactamase superfamily II)